MTQQTNEALKDYLGMIAKALDPVARAHQQGTKEINKLTNESFSKFTQYMARNRKNWDDVTWGILYKYLMIPNQFGLKGQDINKLVLDPDIKSKIPSIIRTLPANYMTDSYAKPSQPVGGDNTDGKAGERSQVIIRMMLELAAIEHLDKATGEREEDIPDPTATPASPSGGPAPPASPSGGPAPPASPSGGPTGPVNPSPTLTRPTKQRSSDPALDALYLAKYRLEMSMYQLQGGTP